MAIALIRSDDPVIGVLDREEPGQGGFPGGVGMVGLHEPPIGALHFVEGRASLESERAIRVVGWHRSCRGSWTSPLV
jgi:hypothetical protein